MSSPAAERIRKRFARPVTVGNGEKFFVRSLTVKEHRRLDSVSDATLTTEQNNIRRNGLFYALALCEDENATPIYPQAEGEPDADWSARVMEEMTDIQPEAIADLLEAIHSNGKAAKAEAVIKN